ncbi:MAG: sugar phosphate isomerase/epimerase [Clostridia bacterium]|nr:sugar phosphate isomerase/epimerase [Clostridia bacterium]
MAFGVSTSCLYPMPTEDALRTLGALGVKTCEIFLNAPSETTPAFAKELRRIADGYGMRIVSAHPFSSFAEGYMFFGEYERRFHDMLDAYRRHFEVAALLGAKLSVIHGARLPLKIPERLYCERFAALNEAAKPFGLIAAQENVNRHISESPAFLRRMRAALGPDFHLVFDIKQAVRAGFDPLPFYREFAAETLHLHVSDHTAQRDCVAPGTGDFDFSALLAATKDAGYRGDWIIELYRAGFGAPAELRQALDYLEALGG